MMPKSSPLMRKLDRTTSHARKPPSAGTQGPLGTIFSVELLFVVISLTGNTKQSQMCHCQMVLLCLSPLWAGHQSRCGDKSNNIPRLYFGKIVRRSSLTRFLRAQGSQYCCVRGRVAGHAE